MLEGKRISCHFRDDLSFVFDILGEACVVDVLLLLFLKIVLRQLAKIT